MKTMDEVVISLQADPDNPEKIEELISLLDGIQLDPDPERKSIFDLAFWAAEDELLYLIIFPLIKEFVDHAIESSLADLIAIGYGVEWDLVNTEALRWARQYSYELVKGINDTSRKYLQEVVGNWIEEGGVLDELERLIEPMFGMVRSKMIAATEVTRAYGEGNLITWRESGVVKEKRWMTARDELVCKICGGLDGQVVELDAFGFPTAKGGSVSTPPAHVNCRCWLQPVV